MQKDKILITGGAGFIGSHLAKALLKRGFSVIIIDNLSNGFRSNIPLKAKFYQKDITNKTEIFKIFRKEKPKYVVHLAAQVSVSKSLIFPCSDAKTNIIGTINILEACKNFSVKKIIFISSAAVYGNNSSLPFKESSKTLPLNPYGCSKLSAENYVILYNKCYKIPFFILRLSNVYGPCRLSRRKEGGVINIFCQQMVQGKQPNIYGDGHQARDFIFVEDACEAILKSLLSKKSNLILNVSSGKLTSILELVRIINSYLKSNIQPRFLPPRKGDPLKNVLSNHKIKKELKWKPKTSLTIGIYKTLNYYKNLY